jgi:hypothetical protein
VLWKFHAALVWKSLTTGDFHSTLSWWAKDTVDVQIWKKVTARLKDIIPWNGLGDRASKSRFLICVKDNAKEHAQDAKLKKREANEQAKPMEALVKKHTGAQDPEVANGALGSLQKSKGNARQRVRSLRSIDQSTQQDEDRPTTISQAQGNSSNKTDPTNVHVEMTEQPGVKPTTQAPDVEAPEQDLEAVSNDAASDAAEYAQAGGSLEDMEEEDDLEAQQESKEKSPTAQENSADGGQQQGFRFTETDSGRSAT